MLKNSFILQITLCLLGFQLTSCKMQEKMVYFQNESDSLTVQATFSPILQVDDFLSIQIMGMDPESLIDFNLPAEMTNAGQNGYTIGAAAKSGYLIDSDGTINLPVIGVFPMAGLSRKQATLNLQERLEEYTESPIVQIQILNYKITVLGDVRTPGTYKIPNERITIIEAIGLAGDLKPTSERKNVLVIREVDGKKMEYRVDLTSKGIFSSPVYYLRQNDVVYVQPNVTALSESSFVRATGSIILSLTSLIITTITLITQK